jgi:hypothetical protein
MSYRSNTIDHSLMDVFRRFGGRLRHQHYDGVPPSIGPMPLIQPRLYFHSVPMCRALLDNLSNECNNSLFHVMSDDPLSDRLRIHVQCRRLVALSRVVALVQSITVFWKY